MNPKLTSGRPAAQRKRRGSTMVEMVLVGIPTLFILISIFEISRGIWLYHTLAYAAKEGVRYATVHGVNCVPNPPSIYNNCTQTVGQVAAVIENAGVGLDLAATNVTFTSQAGTNTYALGACVSSATKGTCSSVWPPNDGISNTPGQSIAIEVVTPFRSALALFFPGARMVSFAAGNLAGSSQDNMRY